MVLNKEADRTLSHSPMDMCIKSIHWTLLSKGKHELSAQGDLKFVIELSFKYLSYNTIVYV